jgi:hypothetical protein
MFKIGVKGKGYDYIGDPPPPPPESGGPSGSAPLCKGSKGQPRKIISSPRLSSCVVYKKLTFNLCLHTKIYLCKIVDCNMLQLGRTKRILSFARFLRPSATLPGSKGIYITKEIMHTEVNTCLK